MTLVDTLVCLETSDWDVKLRSLSTTKPVSLVVLRWYLEIIELSSKKDLPQFLHSYLRLW